MYICAAVLPIAYVVGLLFTLKTHSHIIHAKVEQDEEEGMHFSVAPKVYSSIPTVVYRRRSIRRMDERAMLVCLVGLYRHVLPHK